MFIEIFLTIYRIGTKINNVSTYINAFTHVYDKKFNMSVMQ